MAGRNVGAIELTVNADTGKMVAQVVRDGEIAGQGSGRAMRKAIDKELNNIGGAGLDSRLAVINAKMEAAFHNLDIDLGVNDTEARKDVKKLEALVAATRLELDAVVDFDVAEYELELEAVEQALSSLRIDTEVALDRSDIIQVKADLERIFRRIEVEIGVDLDDKDILANKLALDRAFNDAGGSAGDNFGLGLNSRLAKITAAVAAIAQPAIVGLTGVVSAATAVIGSLFNGAAASIAALSVQFVGIGNALGGLITGFRGFGDAFSAINEEMAAATAEGRAFNSQADDIVESLAGLSPNAQAAAKSFANLRTAFADAQEEVQEELFEGVNVELQKFAGQTLDDVTGALKIGAKQVNAFGKELNEIAANTEFTEIFEDLEPVMDNLSDAGAAFVRTIEPFLKAAAPAAELLAQSFEDTFEALERVVTEGEKTGSLEDFLVRGVESAQEFGRLLLAVGDALGTIFAAGQASGDSFIVSLTGVIERWDDWLESVEGQDALQSFFDQGSAIIESFTPVIEGLREAFDEIVSDDAVGNFDALAVAIGNALPVIGDMLAILGDAGLFTAVGNLLAVVGPLVAAIDLIPGPVLEVIGTVLVAVGAMVKLKAAIDGAKLAFAAFSNFAKTNPVLLGLSVAAAGVALALGNLGDSTEETAARTRDLDSSLEGIIDRLIQEDGAARDAALGVKALDEALTSGSDGGDELSRSLGVLGLNAGDATKQFVALGEDSSAVIRGFGEELGLSGASLDSFVTNMEAAGTEVGTSAEAISAYARETGKSEAVTAEWVEAVKTLVNESRAVDLDDLIQDQIRTAQSTDEATAALVEEALAGRDLSEVVGDDLVDLLDDVTQGQAKLAAGTDESTTAFTDFGEASRLVQESIDEAVAASQKFEQKIIDQGKAAYEAARLDERLAETQRDVAVASAEAAGFTADTASTFISLGDAAREAASQADALSSAFDLLFGATISADEAFDEYLTNISEINDALLGAGESQIAFTGDINDWSEGSVVLRENIRENIDGLLSYAEASLAAGESNATVAQQVEDMRANLVSQYEQYGLTKEAADGYITSLIGTPETVSTLIQTPGLIDALLNTDDLQLDYDALGNPVITSFNTPGLEVAITDSEALEGLVNDLDKASADAEISATMAVPTQAEIDANTEAVETLDSTTADALVESSTAEGMQEELDELIETMGILDRETADPEVDIPAYRTAKTELDTLIEKMGTLDGSSASPGVVVPGIVTQINLVNSLQRAINNLSGKTITVTTRNVTQNIGGNMTGGLITSPQITQVGERGLAEAIIPLQLPLNRVDPAVRGMAAQLRGEGPPPATGGGTVDQSRHTTNHWTINDVSGDPNATAQKVLNRIGLRI